MLSQRDSQKSIAHSFVLAWTIKVAVARIQQAANCWTGLKNIFRILLKVSPQTL